MTTPQQDQLIARIENDFSYHQPKSPEIATLLDQIRDDFKELALSLVDRCPTGRDLSLVISDLDSGMKNAIASIIREQDRAQEMLDERN